MKTVAEFEIKYCQFLDAAGNLAAGAPIIRIGSDQHLALAMRRTPFVHPDAVLLNDQFGFYAAQALGAQRDGGVVKEIGSNLRHVRVLAWPSGGCPTHNIRVPLDMPIEWLTGGPSARVPGIPLRPDQTGV